MLSRQIEEQSPLSTEEAKNNKTISTIRLSLTIVPEGIKNLWTETLQKKTRSFLVKN